MKKKRSNPTRLTQERLQKIRKMQRKEKFRELKTRHRIRKRAENVKRRRLAEERKENDSFGYKLLSAVTNRYNIVAVLFGVVAVIFSLRLFNIQVVEHEKYTMQSQSKLLNKKIVQASRGSILDRNGKAIATVKKTFAVEILKTGLKSNELNSVLHQTYKILKKNDDDCLRTLETYIDMFPKAEYGPMLVQLKNKPKKLRERVNLHLALEFNEGEKITVQAIYDALKKKYGISDEYKKKDAFAIMCMRYEIRNYSATSPMTIASGVSKRTISEIEELSYKLSGVCTDKVSVRKYKDSASVSHVLGYIRGETKTGIEQTMDEYLKGTDGYNTIEINDAGQAIESVDTKPAESGGNVILTIDMNLQKKSAKLLKKAVHENDASSGALVAMDPKTGEVLAMCSYPTYDSSVFLSDSDNKAAQRKISKLLNDSSTPMLNRCISSAFMPGSVYKPVVGTAGLESGKISLNSSYIYDPRVVYYDGIMRTCLEGGHGSLNLQRALQTSCNVYFYELGVKCGIGTVDKWAKAYGLGELTGIELPGEITGTRSNQESKEKYKSSEGPWGELNTAISSIGQYLNMFTPIQMASYCSTLANDGVRCTPHVVQKIVKSDGTIVKETSTKGKSIGAKKADFKIIREGMKAVTRPGGTAATVFSDYKYRNEMSVAAKTGTSENGVGQKDSAAFMCYAPADDPEIAVYVYLPSAGWGWSAGVPAKGVLEEYFDLKYKKKVQSKQQEVLYSEEGPAMK